MRCSAVSAPTVMSVPDMSLSIEPTSPTSRSTGCAAATSDRQLARLDQLGQQLRPLLAEQVRARQAAVAADHDERVDAAVGQIPRGPAPALPGPELRRTRRADHRAAALQDAAHVLRLEAPDRVAALDQPAVPLLHGVHVDAMVQRRAHDGAQRGVHPTGVTTAGDHSDACGIPGQLVHPRPLVQGRIPFISHNRARRHDTRWRREGRSDGIDALVMLPHLLTERVPTISTTKAVWLARCRRCGPGDRGSGGAQRPMSRASPRSAKVGTSASDVLSVELRATQARGLSAASCDARRHPVSGHGLQDDLELLYFAAVVIALLPARPFAASDVVGSSADDPTRAVLPSTPVGLIECWQRLSRAGFDRPHGLATT